MSAQTEVGKSKPSASDSFKELFNQMVCQKLFTHQRVKKRPCLWTSPDLDHCCSLTSDIWKFDPSTILPARRDYMTPAHRAILTIEMEHVKPNDLPHHPFDRIQPAHSKCEFEFELRAGGIAINSRTEQIYAADREHDQILVFGPDGEFQQRIGRFGIQAGQFNRPIGLAYDAVWDRLYVADKNNHRVQVFTSTGQFLFHFGGHLDGPGLLKYPWGLSVSKDGSLVAVADNGYLQVQLFKCDGTLVGNYGMTTSSPWRDDQDIFQCPRGVAFDNPGRFLYVTDFKLHCVIRIDIRSSQVVKVIDESELCQPSGIEVDSSGNVLVCDSANSSVKVFCSEGHPLLKRIYCVAGKVLDRPLDVAVNPAGYLAVVDRNGRIQIF